MYFYKFGYCVYEESSDITIMSEKFYSDEEFKKLTYKEKENLRQIFLVSRIFEITCFDY